MARCCTHLPSIVRSTKGGNWGGNYPTTEERRTCGGFRLCVIKPQNAWPEARREIRSRALAHRGPGVSAAPRRFPTAIFRREASCPWYPLRLERGTKRVRGDPGARYQLAELSLATSRRFGRSGHASEPRTGGGPRRDRGEKEAKRPIPTPPSAPGVGGRNARERRGEDGRTRARGSR